MTRWFKSESDFHYLLSMGDELCASFAKHETKFKSVTTNNQRVNFFVTNTEEMEKAQCIFNQDATEAKNDDKAIEIRESGNVHFKDQKFVEALEKYTSSVAWAKSNVVASLAYGNRSAVLFKLGLHKECVTDIDRALVHNYPDNLKAKLISRKENAIKMQKVSNEESVQFPIIPPSQQNLLIQSASNCIQIQSGQNYNRHIIATRDIEIGEILVAEKSFALQLYTDYFFYCHECLTVCCNLIPCDNCTGALYCSEICKKNAFRKYHKYECPILQYVKMLGQLIDLSLITFKMTLLSKYMPNDKSGSLLYRSDRYHEISKLESHNNKRRTIDLYAMSQIAARVFYLLKMKTDLFTDYENFEETFKEHFLLNFQIAETNSFSFFQLETDSLLHLKNNNYARGICSLFSMFNHSCYPNTFYYTCGSKVIVRAISTIKKGDQCFISYGLEYGGHSKTVRSTVLQVKFYFICKCRACEEDWPDEVNKGNQCSSLDFVADQLFKRNIEFVKYILPFLIRDLKSMEKNKAPSEDVLFLRHLIRESYRVTEIFPKL